MTTSFPISADEDAWQIGSAEVSGLPLLVRIRPNLAEFPGREAFSQKLTVGWNYGDDGETGMPSEDQSENMGFWEDSLIEAFEAVEAGILAYVLTYQGQREWHIYFNSVEQMQAALNDALAGMYPMPLTMEAEEDADWSHFSALMASIPEDGPESS